MSIQEEASQAQSKEEGCLGRWLTRGRLEQLLGRDEAKEMVEAGAFDQKENPRLPGSHLYYYCEEYDRSSQVQQLSRKATGSKATTQAEFDDVRGSLLSCKTTKALPAAKQTAKVRAIEDDKASVRSSKTKTPEDLHFVAKKQLARDVAGATRTQEDGGLLGRRRPRGCEVLSVG